MTYEYNLKAGKKTGNFDSPERSIVYGNMILSGICFLMIGIQDKFSIISISLCLSSAAINWIRTKWFLIIYCEKIYLLYFIIFDSRPDSIYIFHDCTSFEKKNRR